MAAGFLLLLVGGSILLLIACFVLVFGLMRYTTPEENPVRDRLVALKVREESAIKKERQMLFETAVQLAEPFSKKMYGQNYDYQGKIKACLTEAGQPDNDTAIWRFVAAQIATAAIVAVFAFVIVFMLAAKNMGPAVGLVLGVLGLGVGAFAGRYLPIMNLKMTAGKRKTEIRYTLPDTLDLMVVCVEAGLGLDSTIARVGDECEKMAPEISYELRRVTKELNAGIPRSEAFQNLGTRSGVDEMRSLCNMIVQADKLGTSISQALRIYADDVRTRRRQKAEELAAKASIKMTFPLVIFVFPPLFIVLMGPMVIQALGTFF